MSAFGGNTMVPNSGQFSNHKPSGFGDRRTGSNNGNGSNGNSNNGNRKKGNRPGVRNNKRPNDVSNQGSTSSGTNTNTNTKFNTNPKNRKKFDRKQGIDPEIDDIDTLPEVKVIPKTNTKYQSHLPQEIQLTGPLIPNFQSIGFRPKNVQVREVPKYLQVQPRVISPIPFTQDVWDKQNQDKMNQMEAQNNGSDFQGLYEQFQQMREIERKKMEDLGLVDAENIRKDLNDAISFQGTCVDMCPTFERVRRALENNVKKLEKDPTTNKISKAMAVKAFSRPAAGQPPPLPSEVRPPFILSKTLDYLIDHIVPQLPEAHSFIWDRTRSIRQDFTYQNYYGPEAIDCNEKIVRIHLISLHIMAGSEVEYSQQQELEQFNKALQTLMEIYQDVRNHGGVCPNEPEFRAYYLLSHLRESEIETEIQSLPDYILQDDLVQLAIKSRNLTSQNNMVERGFKNSIGSFNLFVEFFRLVYHESTPFLLSCLLETQFNEIRFYAVKAMTRSYHTKGKAYDGETMKSMLGFNTIDELVKYLQYYEIDIINENGVILVDLVNKEKLESKYKINSTHDKPKLSQPYSKQLDKKINKKYSEFINCGKSNDDLKLKNPDDLKILQQNKKTAEVKAGSFADFLNKGTGPGNGGTGFGKFGANDSNGTKVSSGFGSNGPSEFGSSGVSGTTSNQVTSFGQVNAISGFKAPTNNFAKPIGKSETRPEINSENTIDSKPSFKSDKPTFNFNPQSSNLFGKTPTQTSTAKPSVPSFLSKQSENEAPQVPQFKTQPATVSTPILPQSVEPTSKLPSIAPSAPEVSTAPKPVLPKPVPKVNYLKDSPFFNQAAKQLVESVLSETVDEELNKFLKKLIKHENERRERSRIIDLFSTELYEAFINEIVFKSALETKAQQYYTNKLKKKYIQKIKAVGEKYQKRSSLKRKRQDELSDTKFGSTNGLKRQLSGTSSVSSKRRHIWNETSIDEIVDKRNEVEKLWEPINFKHFVERLNGNLSINISVQQIEMKVLVLVENFKLNYSRWLISKFGMKPNKEQGVYETQSQSDKINLQLVSLPERTKLNKEFFKNIPFIVFECGLLTQDTKFPSVQTKLKRDSMILKKILEFVAKYSDYKVQVLLVYWDVSNSKLDQQTIETVLNIGQFKHQYDVIKQVILCDMSGSNINSIINEGIVNLSNNFNGELSTRGEKNRQIFSTQAIDKPIKSQVSNDKFKKNEIKMIQKAKLDKKYSFLNNHSMMNQSMNQSNQSLLNPNWNRTINRNFTPNRTFRNNSTVLESTFINSTNNSILGAFGNEIIEESTPVNSPKKEKQEFLQPKPVAPKTSNLQQLIDLTTKVRQKYGKESRGN